MRAFCLVLLVSGPFALAACNSQEPTEALPLGQFEAEIRGGLTRDLSGSAGYIAPSEGTPGLFVSLVNLGQPERSIAINDPEGALRADGTYPLGDFDGPFVDVTYFDRRGDVASTLRAVEGTVRVTQVEGGRIEGTVTAQMAAGFERTATSTLTATFTATPVAPRD